MKPLWFMVVHDLRLLDHFVNSSTHYLKYMGDLSNLLQPIGDDLMQLATTLITYHAPLDLGFYACSALQLFGSTQADGPSDCSIALFPLPWVSMPLSNDLNSAVTA